MALSLREQLAARPDLKEKTVDLDMGGTVLTVTIARLTVGERKVLLGTYGMHTDTPDNVGMGIALVAKSVRPEMTIEDVEALPAAVVDELSVLITEFNGWTKKEQAKIADSFRPSA